MTASAPAASSFSIRAALLLGAVQGAWLYWLHSTPTKGAAWFLPLLTLGILIPPAAALLLSDRFRGRVVWAAVAVLAATVAAVSAHQGWVAPVDMVVADFARFPFWAALAAMVLIALPCVQTRLAAGNWTHYPTLFRYAWQNPLFLAEAGLFTGAFWLLLLLWAQLFLLIGIDFFRELFSDARFAYPVTGMVFSAALRLVATRENISVFVRRHALGLLLWLLPLVATICGLFLIALPLQGLAYIGKAGVSTGMMVWTIASLVTFYNAAYQDGESPPPYPAALRTGLRIAVIALVALAILAVYGLGLRVHQHGWSVARVWAAAATGLGLLYGLGYAAAAWRSEPWMAGMSKVNTGMAIVCLGLLVALLSPILSPHRIAANNQVARLMDGRVGADQFDYNYLRFSLGKPGLDALATLASIESHPERDTIRARARRALEKRHKWELDDVVADSGEPRLEPFPPAGAIDPSFIAFLKATRTSIAPRCAWQSSLPPCRVLVIDLNADRAPELVVDDGGYGMVFHMREGAWRQVARISLHNVKLGAAAPEATVKAVAPEWKDLEIDGRRHRLIPFDQ